MILPAGDYDLDEGATSRVSRNSKEEGKNGAELAASCNVQQEASPLQDPRKKRCINSCVRRKSGCVCMPPEPQGVPCRFFIPSENCKAIEMHKRNPAAARTVYYWYTTLLALVRTGMAGECLARWSNPRAADRPAPFSVEGTRPGSK